METILKTSFRTWAAQQYRLPVLAALLRNRWITLLFIGIVFVHFIIASAFDVGWPCPVRMATGLPCPGCGLTQATLHLLSGRWHAAFSEHALAPVFFAGILLGLTVSLLPTALQRRSVDRIQQIERQTGIVTLFLIVLVVYWIIRMASLIL